MVKGGSNKPFADKTLAAEESGAKDKRKGKRQYHVALDMVLVVGYIDESRELPRLFYIIAIRVDPSLFRQMYASTIESFLSGRSSQVIDRCMTIKHLRVVSVPTHSNNKSGG